MVTYNFKHAVNPKHLTLISSLVSLVSEEISSVSMYF